MKDRGRTKLYIFTVQALTSRTGDGRETHEYQETLAGSFYEFLAVCRAKTRAPVLSWCFP